MREVQINDLSAYDKVIIVYPFKIGFIAYAAFQFQDKDSNFFRVERCLQTYRVQSLYDKIVNDIQNPDSTAESVVKKNQEFIYPNWTETMHKLSPDNKAGWKIYVDSNSVAAKSKSKSRSNKASPVVAPRKKRTAVKRECKVGKTRNSKGRCVLNSPKRKRTSVTLECKAGKKRNADGRCVKDCVRNKRGRCLKTQRRS